jgi:hypothetical protein
MNRPPVLLSNAKDLCNLHTLASAQGGASMRYRRFVSSPHLLEA